MTTEQKKEWIILAIFAIAIIITSVSFYLLVLNPLNEDRQTVKRELEMEESITVSLQNQAEEIEVNEEELNRILTALPVQPLEENWLQDLYQGEQASNLFVERIAISETVRSITESQTLADVEVEEEAPADEVVVPELTETVTTNEEVETSEEFEGMIAAFETEVADYADILTYFEAIESLERYSEILSFTFGVQDDETTELLEFDFSLQTYYLAEGFDALGDVEFPREFSRPADSNSPFRN